MTARNWPPLLMMTAPARWHWMRGGGIFTADSPEDIRKTIGKTGYDRAPAILKITSADKAVHGFMDEFGGVQLPGLQGSVQENIKRLNKRLSRASGTATCS